MRPAEMLRKYPRLVSAMMAVIGEDDEREAAAIVVSAKAGTVFARGIVREAFQKRGAHRTKWATRQAAPKCGVAGEVPLVSHPSMSSRIRSST